MQTSAGLCEAQAGLENQSWDILGQTYVPKHVSESCFSWHATLPAETFVPRHRHDTQDEYIFILEGNLDFVLDQKDIKAGPGDMVALPRGIPHSIHNNSGSTVKCIFWVTPTRMLYEYFPKISGMTDKDEIARLAGEHEVPFG